MTLTATPAVLAAQASLPAGALDEGGGPVGANEVKDPQVDDAAEAVRLWEQQLGPAWRLRTFKPAELQRLSQDLALEHEVSDVKAAVQKLRNMTFGRDDFAIRATP